MTANNHLHDDALEIRAKINAPDERRYTLEVKRDHIRIRFDDDVALAGNDRLWRAFRERGYSINGINFDSKLVVMEKES